MVGSRGQGCMDVKGWVARVKGVVEPRAGEVKGMVGVKGWWGDGRWWDQGAWDQGSQGMGG